MKEITRRVSQTELVKDREEVAMAAEVPGYLPSTNPLEYKYGQATKHDEKINHRIQDHWLS